MTIVDHLIYGALWLSFGAGHSLLAGATLRRVFGGGDRLAYNVIALAHFGVVVAVGRLWLAPGSVPFDRPGWLLAVQWTLAAIGLAGFAVAVRGYDLGLLAGTAQLRAARRGETLDDSDETLHLDGLHAYVRHPLYTAILFALWGLVDLLVG